MLLTKTVVAVFFVIAVICQISAIPSPGIFRERHIIHAPIKFRTIHHYSVKKVPLIITKHLHFYKQKEEIHHFPHPDLEENQIHQEDDHHHFEFPKQEKHPKEYTPKYPPYEGWKPQEEEYDEQSQEEYDDDYEYE